MELVSLKIERFGCLAQASIAFKPGLNVLHGANEVGKSSIARAIRFALLLPSSSSAVEPWLPWSGSGHPTVTLVFKTGSCEYYRVKKVFGTTTASLERSSDGEAWANPTRAREVEARLRALLRWGIPEPGGAKAPKGLPDSFLARALLADQEAIVDIFERDLGEDSVDSGRVRISTALQVMAQDPLFKSVLAVAQERVEEAFTASGARKRGSNDPFRKVADDISARRRERDEAEEDARSARLLADRVTTLQRDLAGAEADLQEAAAKLDGLEQRRTRQNALTKASAELKAGQTLVEAVTEAKKKHTAAVELLGTLGPSIPALRMTADDARKAFESATADASAEREKRQGRLAQEETTILRDRDVLRIRQTRLNLAIDLRDANTLHEQSNELATNLKALDQEIAALAAVEPWMELRDARVALVAAGQREKTAGELLEKATALRSRAAREWPSPNSSLLPGSERLAQLRELRRDLDIAEAKLDVGFSVEVRGAQSVSISADGARKQTKIAPFSLEAKASARIELPDGIEVMVHGGRMADRKDAERKRTKWLVETQSLFAMVAVSDLPALEDLCRVDAEVKRRAEALEREAAAADAARTALGDPTDDRQRHAARILELERRLDGADLVIVERLAEAHGVRTRMVLSTKSLERESKREVLANFRAQEATLRQRAMAGVAGDALADIDAEVKALETAMNDLDERDRRLTEERRAIETPSDRHDALKSAATAAEAALNEALGRMETARIERDTWGARLQERQAAAATIDMDALTRAEATARAATSTDGAPVDESVIVGVRKAKQSAEDRYEALLGDLRKAEGALHASGGASADDRLRDLDAALQRAQEKQEAVEDEYEAWKLLVETLKEAERTQATHLGNVLAPDLSSRFRAMAGQRYSGIALGPHLALEGIDAAGGRRDLQRLSIGTREQLSTLFRLCLAERLQSALLLDDQLVQSDPERLRWFRRALRETAGSGVQVVVLTCRPDDYLEPAETPAPHVIDLGGVVQDAR